VTSAPRSGPLFTASFDDGHEDDLVTAERFAKAGARATFYVALNAPDAPEISAASLRRLRALGMEVGSHTARHRLLTGRPYDDVLRDLVDGRRGVEDLIGEPVTALSYPEGACDDGVARAAAEAGFKTARTTIAFRTALGNDPFRLPVTVEFEKKSGFAHARHALRDGNVVGLARWATTGGLSADPVRLVKRFLVAASRHGGFVHLRARSWEIVRGGLLDDLDAVLAAAASTPGLRHATNSELARAYHFDA
jgi:peptidoglycan/xylan/chitin deacetylase (PgdA/CDA1 family)